MLALLCAVAPPLTAGLANHTAVNRTAHATTHRASNATAATLSAHRQKPLLCALPLVIRGCGANERDGLAMWQALVIVCAVLCGARVHRVARTDRGTRTHWHPHACASAPPSSHMHACRFAAPVLIVLILIMRDRAKQTSRGRHAPLETEEPGGDGATPQPLPQFDFEESGFVSS